MPITILPPAPAVTRTYDADFAEDNDFDRDPDGDVDMGDGGQMRSRPKASKHVVTPGELVTDDPQWMR
jgi:exosome complex component RRP4